MAESYEFLSLQGASHLAKNIAGAKVLREMGNQTSVKLSIKSDVFSVNETKTGDRQKVGEWTKAREVNLEISLNEQKKDDVALAFQAEQKEIPISTIQDQDLGSGLKVGDKIKLDGFNISALMVSDSTNGTPVSAEEDVHYAYDPKFGTLTILSLTGLTQPLIADYTRGSAQASVIFTLPDNVDFYYLFEGINAVNGENLALELWRFKPLVDGQMEFINEELGEITVKGSALADTSKQNDEKLGGFGRIVYLG